MALTEQQIKELQGLTDAEVAERQKTEGLNELPASKKRSIFAIAFEVIKEPMFILLVACGLIYLFLGDVQEACMLLGFVFVIMGITIYQEGKTEKALDALKDLSSPRALVIRNGERKRIAGKEVVRDDVLILAEGDRVPADCLLLWGVNLSVDESLLTGESIAVRKAPAADTTQGMGRPGGDDLPFVYSGTLVTGGQGVAQVKAIGAQTELGKIGRALAVLNPEETLLQQETNKIVKVIFFVAIALCALLVVFSGLVSGNWLKGTLSGITLAMAMLPEEFPVVLTIFLALGAWRISQKKVLTRRMTAVETLGAASVLCVDKTGTLTQNRMSIRMLYAEGRFFDVFEKKSQDLPEHFHELIEYGILASQRDPFDPMEKALKTLGDIKLMDTEHLHEDWELIHQYPLSRELLALSHVWESPDGEHYIISANGAPEAVADLCHLDAAGMQKLTEKITIMAESGLRVLGVAKAQLTKSGLPEIQHDFDFEFIGLIGLEDPIRETVPLAVKECYQAGIRVVMITGDYATPAQNIARQIGLKNTKHVITGPELEQLSEAELKEKLRNIDIFARVVPEQKLLIVNALKADGLIVAMTGDGVNDAPALKSAHIGVAMGERGTDVAREASDLVLLDDSFPAIVEAVKQGRRIFDNLQKAMSYIISIHIPIAGMSLLPVLFKWPEILFPIQIVFLELIIDPACSVVFEAEQAEADIMQRKPRQPGEPLFSKKTLIFSIVQGLLALLVLLGIYTTLMLGFGKSSEDARTVAFAALVISNIGIILVNRSFNNFIPAIIKVRNTAFTGVVAGALAFLGLVIYTPFLQNLFHFKAMHVVDILIALSVGLICILSFEVLKYLMYRKRKV
jgi:Ca2+-transporting ATPase